MGKYVYLMMDETGRYKLGFTKNLKLRLKQHSTGNAEKITLLYSYLTPHYSKIETALKNRYKPYKKEGEWYELSIKTVNNFIIDCKNVEDNINYLLQHSTLTKIF